MRRKLAKKIPPREEARARTDQRSPEELEQIVVGERRHLFNRGLQCGAAVLRRHLREHGGVEPVPSVRQIGQVLTRFGLTYGRTGWYEGEEPDWLPSSARIPTSERR